MILNVCKKIMDKIIEKQEGQLNILLDMEIWDWSQGVALYGIWKYYELKKEGKYLDYLIQWFDRHLEELPMKNVNTMAPLLTLCNVYEVTKNQKYLDLCIEWGDWVMDEMPKTKDGGVQHITIDSDNYQQLWIDTLFMTGLFLGRLGKLTGNAKFGDEAKKQFLVHIKYLFDKETGLWFHGWTFEGNHNYAKALWGRGNCWFTIAAMELGEVAVLEPWFENYILDTYQSQVSALKSMQHPKGMWHTLVNDPQSYLEVSGTAGFTYGILKGIRKGYLPEAYKAVAFKAVEAILEEIDEEGVVHNVSYGTVVSQDLDYYRKVALKSTGYGQNLVLMMLVELLTWESMGLKEGK